MSSYWKYFGPQFCCGYGKQQLWLKQLSQQLVGGCYSYFQIACELCCPPSCCILGQPVYFWTAKLQLGQLCFILFHSWLSRSKCFNRSVYAISRFNQSGMIIMFTSNSRLVLLHNSCHSQDSHRRGNKPSGSHVGPNQQRVLTVTINRMKICCSQEENCVLWLVRSRFRSCEYLRLEAATVNLRGWEKLPHLSLCCFTFTTGVEARGVNMLMCEHEERLVTCLFMCWEYERDTLFNSAADIAVESIHLSFSFCAFPSCCYAEGTTSVLLNLNKGTTR